MIQHKNTFNCTKNLVISVIAVSLAACSAGTESTNTPTDSASSPSSSLANSSSPQPTASPANVTIPGVSDIGEVNFKPASKNSLGFFDGINGSSTPRIKVSKTTPLTASGWAVMADEIRPADSVIITYGENNSLVAVTPVNLERPDVVKVLKNPSYKNSGWSATFNSSTLPAGPVVLKAWVYNSELKEATQLNNTHEVVVVD